MRFSFSDFVRRQNTKNIVQRISFTKRLSLERVKKENTNVPISILIINSPVSFIEGFTSTPVSYR